jgi:hypothetical protein
MNPCRHLDYDVSKYGDACELVTEKENPNLAGFSCQVKYWRRKRAPEGAPVNVQFCQLRGRINSVFGCYNEGEMSCHESGEREGQ